MSERLKINLGITMIGAAILFIVAVGEGLVYVPVTEVAAPTDKIQLIRDKQLALVEQIEALEAEIKVERNKINTMYTNIPSGVINGG